MIFLVVNNKVHVCKLVIVGDNFRVASRQGQPGSVGQNGQ